MVALCCFLCQAPLVDTRFIECPSVDHHRFCFECTQRFIRDNFNAGKLCLYCPSGLKCIIRGFTTPWHFVEREIAAILPADEYEAMKNRPDRKKSDIGQQESNSLTINNNNNNIQKTTCFHCHCDLSGSDRVVHCETVAEHNFCYQCAASFICKQGLNEANCPSGQSCLKIGTTSAKPWYFSMTDIQRIMGTPTFTKPSSAVDVSIAKKELVPICEENKMEAIFASKSDALECTMCNSTLSAQFIQCPTVKAHKFCMPCTRSSIGKQNCDKTYCPSGAQCALYGAYIPWSFMEFEIKSILTDDEYVSLKHKRAQAKNPIVIHH